LIDLPTQIANPRAIGVPRESSRFLQHGMKNGLLPAVSRISFDRGCRSTSVFACTPDMFPDLMAAALRRDDIAAWAGARDIALVRAAG
jgi:hypothetical protein